MRILLIHLSSFGDCVFATAIARQIKLDHPGCQLVWAISSECRQVLENNTQVDEIIEFSEPPSQYTYEFLQGVHQQFLARQAAGEFFAVFFTQICSYNTGNFDGNIRSSHFRGYPRPIRNVVPVIVVSDLEKRRAAQFVDDHGLASNTFNILLEAAPQHGQSYLDSAYSLRLAEEITSLSPDMRVIFSAVCPPAASHKAIIDGSVLSFRENAAISHHCHLLIGGSGGITWLLTADGAKKIPTIQLIDTRAIWLNPLSLDHERWNLPYDHVIELTENSRDRIIPCLLSLRRDGVVVARKYFNEKISPTPYIFELLMALECRGGRFGRFFRVWFSMWHSPFSKIQAFYSGCKSMAKAILRKGV